MTTLVQLLAVNLLALVAHQPTPPAPGPDQFWVRPGYRVTLAAEGFGETRFIVVAPDGTVFVSQPESGTITALRDEDADGIYERQWVVVDQRRTVHGMTIHDGHLYFAMSGAIERAPLPAPGERLRDIQTVIAEGEVPAGGGHWWRTVLIRDGRLWTSIGDSGNITDETETPRQKIWVFTLGADGRAREPRVWATGLRNTEKLLFRPGTNEIWGADHGSDDIGARFGERGGGPVTDMFPPCEFNHYVDGFDYGHPFITGLGWPRPEYAARSDILARADRNTPPAWAFGAHWAPNGWTFLESDALFGRSGDALIAFHGSWNSRRKVGYRIERILFDEVTGRPMGSQRIVGTLNERGAEVLARPCDVAELPDGSVLFTDSLHRRIFRLERVR